MKFNFYTAICLVPLLAEQNNEELIILLYFPNVYCLSQITFALFPV